MTREEFDTLLVECCKGTMCQFHRILEATFKMFELTPPQGAVLGVLQQEGECPITELSQKLHVTKGSLSSLCKRMEAQDLVTRRRSKEDERFVYISMTPRGRAIFERFEDLRKQFYASRLDNVDEKSGEEIIQSMRRLESYAAKTADEFLQLLEENKMNKNHALPREEQTP